LPAALGDLVFEENVWTVGSLFSPPMLAFQICREAIGGLTGISLVLWLLSAWSVLMAF